jgi:hypothetical protein
VGIQRTLRIPDDGGEYPLPPSLGRLPVRPAASYPALVPDAVHEPDQYLVVIHRQDAAWIQFDGLRTDPRALGIAVGGVDAITGEPWTGRLQASPQNYVVVPYQPWLDGLKVRTGVVRQFVAVRLHGGESVEHQLTGRDRGGITLTSFLPRPGTIDADKMPRKPVGRTRELGVGAGGLIAQRIYPDPLGLEIWELSPSRVVHVHLVDADEFTRASGEAVPPSPVDADTYSRFGLPWFEVYDSARGALAATPALATIKSVDEIAGTLRPSSKPKAARPKNVRPIPPRSRRQR